MFLQRNTAGQVFTVPGSLRAVADGSAITAGATIKIQKDGVSASGLGTLTHISGGAWSYAPTQAETDCKIMGYVLEGTGAVTACGSTRTTNADPNDGTHLGLTALPGAAAGAAGGVLIAGANTGPLSISGGVTFSNSAGDAFTCISTGNNGRGFNVSGNGTAEGIKSQGGANGGSGIGAYGGAVNSYGFLTLGAGSGAGWRSSGGPTGSGVLWAGGSTSGAGGVITTTNGNGWDITPTNGHALNLAANGTSKHGVNAVGGTGGVSDGIHAAAGTGGVDVRGNLAGNVTGNLSGSVGSVTAVVSANVTQLVGSATAAANLQAEAQALKTAAVSADVAPTTTSFSSASAGLSANASDYVNILAVFYSGADAPLARKVSAYSFAGGVGSFTITPALPAAPAVGDQFLLIGYTP